MDNKKIKVLAIDDQKFLLQLVKFKLSKADMKVYTALSFNQGLEHLKKQKVDLILLDLSMPEIDGFEALKILKNNPEFKKIPVIVLSSLSDRMNVTKTIQLGAVNFLSKPFNPALTIETIKKTLLNLDRIADDGIRRGFEYFYSKPIIIIKCDNQKISENYIRKIYSTIMSAPGDKSTAIIDLSENVNISNTNVGIFTDLIEILNKKRIETKFVLKNKNFIETFKSNSLLSLNVITDDITDVLPSGFSFEGEKFNRIDFKNYNYDLDVIFKDNIPIINIFLEPGIEIIEKFVNTINDLIVFNKYRIILNLNNVDKLPSRFPATIINYKNDIQIKYSGTIKLVIKSEKLIRELKIGNFLSKFELYHDLNEALENIEL